MDVVLIILGGVLMILGLAGSFLPVLPGPLTSWFGLLALHYTSKGEQSWTFLGWTLAIALFIMALDYIIPILGTKFLGGTKAGVIGSTIGFIVGLFFLPIGIILGPFIGAYVGELSKSPNQKSALKAAFGSLLGFLSGVVLKFVVSVVYLVFFAIETGEVFVELIGFN